MNDDEIIRAVLEGDKEKYAIIVERYQQMVAGLCYKICGNRLDVEEVTQRVFVELYSALPRFQFKAKLTTFLYRITVNTVSKMLNRDKRDSNNVSIEDYRGAAPDGNAEQQMIQDERVRLLRNAIGQLKYEQRTALVLYTYNDFSYQQVAEVLECSLTKVEALIFRAKKNLKKIMDNEK